MKESIRERIGRIKRRKIEEAQRMDRLGWDGKHLRKKPRRELKRYPGIENIEDSDPREIDEDLFNLEVEEVEPDKYEIFGGITRNVLFTYKGSRFQAISNGTVGLRLNDDGESVDSWVSFDGMRRGDYVEITSLDDVELDDDEEEALIEQVIKRTHIIDEDDLIKYLETDYNIQRWVQLEFKYIGKNESRSRHISYKSKSRHRMNRKPVRQRTIAEQYFRRSRGEPVWKLNE